MDPNTHVYDRLGPSIKSGEVDIYLWAHRDLLSNYRFIFKLRICNQVKDSTKAAKHYTKI